MDLIITDNAGESASDIVLVTVEQTPPPPLPTAGPDAIVESDQAHIGSFDSPIMGASVRSAGDVNGDGFGDVIVGAPGWDIAGGLFDEGAAFVFLGGPNGIIDYIWREDTAIIGTGATLTAPLAVGAHTILLQVNDNAGAGSQDSVVVTVTESTQPPPALPQGVVTFSGTATANRGDSVSFTATLTNTGAIPITSGELSLSVAPANRIRKLSPGGTIQVPDVAVGGSVTVTWNGQANKEGPATVTAEALSGGASIHSVSVTLTVLK